MSAPAAITVQPIASPSSPSVRFTALLDPTITSTTNTINGKKRQRPQVRMMLQRPDHQVRTKLLEERHDQVGGVHARSVCIAISSDATTSWPGTAAPAWRGRSARGCAGAPPSV